MRIRKETVLKYFAYGSNLLAARLLARVEAADLGMATLSGWTLRWNYHSVDGSGKCNIEPVKDSTSAVYGVLYEMDKDAFAVLDRIEMGYKRIEVSLDHAGKRAEAWVYVYAQPAPEAAPYSWYKGLVLSGAIEHGFPQGAIQDLKSVAAVPDPVPDRPGKVHAEALLRDAGYAPS